MPRDRQTFMFSATFPVEIQRLAADFMKNYIFVAVGRVGAASKDVTQTVVWKEQDEKIPYVIDYIAALPPNSLVSMFLVQQYRSVGICIYLFNLHVHNCNHVPHT